MFICHAYKHTHTHMFKTNTIADTWWTTVVCFLSILGFLLPEGSALLRYLSGYRHHRRSSAYIEGEGEGGVPFKPTKLSLPCNSLRAA